MYYTPVPTGTVVMLGRHSPLPKGQSRIARVTGGKFMKGRMVTYIRMADGKPAGVISTDFDLLSVYG